MSLWFIIPLAIFFVAVCVFKNSANEIAYLAASIALVSLLVTLCLAPWQIQFLLLMFVLLSNKEQSPSSEPIIESSSQEEENTKRIYRGVNYQVTPPSVEVTENEITGKYRGQVLRIHHIIKTRVMQPTLNLKYRGASVNEPEALIPLETKEGYRGSGSQHTRSSEEHQVH